MNEAGKKLLPWETTLVEPPASCFQFKTMIKPSTIPNAGIGRFALENIPKGSIIIKRKLITIDDITANPNLLFDKTKAIMLQSELDMYKLVIFYYDQCITKPSFSNIKRGLQNFTGSYDGKTVFLMTQATFVNHNTKHFNQTDFVKDGYIYAQALRDIKKNEELFIDYKTYRFPHFYYKFFDQWKMTTMDQTVSRIDSKL